MKKNKVPKFPSDKIKVCVGIGKKDAHDLFVCSVVVVVVFTICMLLWGKHCCLFFRAHYNLPLSLWQMLPSLLKIIQTNKGREGPVLLQALGIHVKLGLIAYWFIQILYIAFHSSFNRERKKEKYWSYYPNGKVICGDQLPIICFLIKKNGLQRGIPVRRQNTNTYLLTFRKKIKMLLWFPEWQSVEEVAIHTPSRVSVNYLLSRSFWRTSESKWVTRLFHYSYF